MVFQRKNKNKKRFKRFKKKNINKKAQTGIVRGAGSGALDIMRVPFRIVTPVRLINHPLVSYIFKANSLFDPDLTSTGTQPYYFDQWKTIYSKYMVEGVSLDFQFGSQSSNTVSYVVAGFTNVNPAGYTMQQLFELPTAKRTTVGSVNGESNGRIRIYTNIRRVVGFSKGSIDAVQSLIGNTNGDPDNVVYGFVAAISSDATTSCNINGIVTLTQYSKLFDKITPTNSLGGETGATGSQQVVSEPGVRI